MRERHCQKAVGGCRQEIAKKWKLAHDRRRGLKPLADGGDRVPSGHSRFDLRDVHFHGPVVHAPYPADVPRKTRNVQVPRCVLTLDFLLAAAKKELHASVVDEEKLRAARKVPNSGIKEETGAGFVVNRSR